MREFVFTITYENGADPLMDLFQETPNARGSSLVCAMDEEKFWRIDRIDGPDTMVTAAKELLLSEDYDSASISTRECDGDRFSAVFEDAAEHCVLYTSVECTERCDAVPFLARQYLPGVLLLDIRRVEDTERWRILTQDDEKIGLLYDTLSARLRDGLEFGFEHLKDVTEPPLDPFSSLELPPEQQRVLEAAFRHGYYATPRETTLDQLSTELGWPRSTVSYRLRRAESELVREFISTY
jgi:predicted DNA binding protein